MPYKKVQFIAYCINTAPKSVKESGTWKQKYVGLQDNSKDINERIKLIKEAIDKAHENGDKSPNTLKIFMVPEFFFRGATGAYPMANVQEVIEGLQSLVKEQKQENWIFVFGTILGFSSPTMTVTRKEGKIEEIDESKDKEIYNFTLVQQGGFKEEKKAPKYAHVVQKELKSDIDFIKAKDMSGGGLALKRVIHLTPLKEERNEFSNLKYEGLSVFKMHGITFGLEVCLDHANQRLKNSKNLPSIDIQLIPSCGMSIKEEAIVVRKFGYVFNCDGITSSDKQIENAGIKIGEFDDGTTAYDSHSAVHFNNNNNFEYLKVESSENISFDVSNIYAHTAGQLHIYPAKELRPAPSLSSSKNLFPRSESSLTTALSSESVILNGMKVIFDQSASAYPVSLQPKTLSSQPENLGFSFTIDGKFAQNVQQMLNGIKPYKQINYKEAKELLKWATESQLEFKTYEDIVIAKWPHEKSAVLAKKALDNRLKEEKKAKNKEANHKWYVDAYPSNLVGTYYRGEKNNDAVLRKGYIARSPLTVEQAREEIRKWFGPNGKPYSQHVAWIRKNKTLDGRRILIATGNDMDCMGYGVERRYYVRKITIDGLREIPGEHITSEILGVSLTNSKEMRPTLVLNADTVNEATVIAVKGVGGGMTGETTFFTTIPIANTKLIYKGNAEAPKEPKGWLYGPNAIQNAKKYRD